MPSSADIVIAGAGVSGLTLASAIRTMTGGALDVVVVDATPDRLSPPQRTSAIAPGPATMLERLDIWRHVVGAEPVRRLEISDTRFDDAVRIPNLTFDAGDAGQSWLAHIVAHRDLETAARGVADLLGVHLVAAHAESFDAGPVRAMVRLSQGEYIACRLVISAEGDTARLRVAAGIKTVSWDYDRTAIAATLEHAHDHDGIAVQHFFEHGPFALLPLPGRRSSLIWTQTSQEAARLLALPDDAFVAEVTTRAGARLGAFRLADRPLSFPLGFSLARDFIAPRFALAGDAAHRVHPLAGQGLNLALRDVALLCEVIVEQAKLGLDIGNADTLRRYQRARRFDASASALGVDLLHRIYGSRGSMATARGVGVAAVQNSPALKRMLMMEAAGLSGRAPELFRAMTETPFNR